MSLDCYEWLYTTIKIITTFLKQHLWIYHFYRLLVQQLYIGFQRLML